MQRRGLSKISLLVIIATVALLIGIFLPALGSSRRSREEAALADSLGALLWGWISYPWTAWSQASLNPDAIAAAIVCFVALGFTGHLFLSWLYRQMARPDANGNPPVWRPRWTHLLLAMTVVVFATYLAIAVIIHQSLWLLSSKEPLVAAASSPRFLDDAMWSAARLWQADAQRGKFDDFTFLTRRDIERVHFALIRTPSGQPFALVCAPRDPAERAATGVLVCDRSTDLGDFRRLSKALRPGSCFPGIIAELEAAAAVATDMPATDPSATRPEAQSPRGERGSRHTH